MQIKAAMLCDAASVREGLLHVLGGGITRLQREPLPTPVSLAVGLLIDVPPAQGARPHEVHVTVHGPGPSGHRLAAAMGGFQQVQGLQMLQKGEHALVAIPVPMTFMVTEHGEHRVRVEIDKDAATETLRFWVVPPPKIPPNLASSN